ncbi:MAG: BatD family protein [Pseudomonadota bacterium]
MKRLALALLILLFIPIPSWAGVQARVDRVDLAPGETLTLAVSIDGDGEVDISPLEDFSVISRGSSTSLNIVNGKMSRSQELRFVLAPKGTGALVIPALPVKTDDGIVRTQPIQIRVSPNPTPQSRAGGGAPDVFLRAVVSENRPFVGQQIIFQLKVFRAVRIANANLQDLTFPGFTSKQVEDQKDYTTTLDGRQYAVTELSFVLGPLDPGRFELGPGVLNCDLVVQGRRSGNSMFDQFFGNDPFFSGGRLEPRVFQSEKVEINVLPLPPLIGPGKFSGLVGRFDFKTELDQASVNVGDSASFAVTIEGQGNIMDAGKPEFPESDGLKVYSDKPEEDISLGSGGYVGKKVFRFALAPGKPGRYLTPALEMTYFDPEQRAYVAKKAQALELEARPGKDKEVQVVMSPASPSPTAGEGLKRKVEFIDRDILPLKSDASVLASPTPLSPTLFFLLLLSPPFIFVVAGAIQRRVSHKKDSSRIMAERAWSALKTAADGRSSDQLGLCSRAVVAAVCSKADREGEALTYMEIEQLLSTCATSELGTEVKTFMERLDGVRYGGRVPERSEIEDIINRTRELVKTLCR